MTVTLISPQGMSAVEWIDAMSDRLWTLGAIPRVSREEDWREWGAALLSLPSIHGILLPDPYQFDDWRRWAERINEAFSSIEL